MPDTEVVTDYGPVQITNLEAGDRVYTLDPLTGVMKLKPITGIQVSQYHGAVYDVNARRVAFRVAPGHPILYETQSDVPPRFKPAERLSDHERHHLINDWVTPPRDAPDTIDVTDFLDGFEVCIRYDGHGNEFRAALPDGCEPIGLNQYVGYRFDGKTFKQHQTALEDLATAVTIRDGPQHGRMPYRFSLSDFIQLIGWYVTEGGLWWKSQRDTVEVQISQTKTATRESIGKLLNRMGIEHSRSKSKFRFGSKLYGKLLEQLCGANCGAKHLPDFVWRLPTAYQRLLLLTLLHGDGTDLERYYTTSDRLARDVCRLCVELGITPRYVRRERPPREPLWEISMSRMNDGIRSSQQVSKLLYSGPIYRVIVRDYPAILSGQHGKCQWIGGNAVS